LRLQNGHVSPQPGEHVKRRSQPLHDVTEGVTDRPDDARRIFRIFLFGNPVRDLARELFEHSGRPGDEGLHVLIRDFPRCGQFQQQIQGGLQSAHDARQRLGHRTDQSGAFGRIGLLGQPAGHLRRKLLEHRGCPGEQGPDIFDRHLPLLRQVECKIQRGLQPAHHVTEGIGDCANDARGIGRFGLFRDPVFKLVLELLEHIDGPGDKCPGAFVGDVPLFRQGERQVQRRPQGGHHAAESFRHRTNQPGIIGRRLHIKGPFSYPGGKIPERTGCPLEEGIERGRIGRGPLFRHGQRQIQRGFQGRHNQPERLGHGVDQLGLADRRLHIQIPFGNPGREVPEDAGRPLKEGVKARFIRQRPIIGCGQGQIQSRAQPAHDRADALRKFGGSLGHIVLDRLGSLAQPCHHAGHELGQITQLAIQLVGNLDLAVEGVHRVQGIADDGQRRHHPGDILGNLCRRGDAVGDARQTARLGLRNRIVRLNEGGHEFRQEGGQVLQFAVQVIRQRHVFIERRQRVQCTPDNLQRLYQGLQIFGQFLCGLDRVRYTRQGGVRYRRHGVALVEDRHQLSQERADVVQLAIQISGQNQPGAQRLERGNSIRYQGQRRSDVSGQRRGGSAQVCGRGCHFTECRDQAGQRAFQVFDRIFHVDAGRARIFGQRDGAVDDGLDVFEDRSQRVGDRFGGPDLFGGDVTGQPIAQVHDLLHDGLDLLERGHDARYIAEAGQGFDTADDGDEVLHDGRHRIGDGFCGGYGGGRDDRVCQALQLVDDGLHMAQQRRQRIIGSAFDPDRQAGCHLLTDLRKHSGR